MKSGRGFLSIFDSLTDRILCVVGAALFSQGPEFMQQYLQRLGGHLDEARRQLATFQKTADQAGLTLDQFISQTAANADSAVANLGGVMTDSDERVTALQTAHDALLQAALWERPFVFLRHLDTGIARATAGVYQPAVPTTAEGLIYAFAGMLFILALYHLGLKRLFGLVFARSRAPATARAGA
ncbi:MAG: hypothetical protein QG602_2047 [Verrucomicrobiota bacterium]|nr:hypothetical protein [Verrucomicrobiota bacterium]